ncbi:hypothetical protein HanIR_Chr11g0511231 [Helianthus annuus]|nr:hypothetical protein HanIR_Chr11g0511231 [Helianthus annuus]
MVVVRGFQVVDCDGCRGLYMWRMAAMVVVVELKNTCDGFRRWWWCWLPGMVLMDVA